jgi:hypothetical protein
MPGVTTGVALPVNAFRRSSRRWRAAASVTDGVETIL